MRYFLIFLILVAGIGGSNIQAQERLADYVANSDIEMKETREGLYYGFKEKGKGPLPTVGDYVKLQYVGKQLDGSIFDKSGEEPIIFKLGHRIVIQGWDLGILHIPVGSTAHLLVPPHLAYGDKGLGSVGPNTPLLFEIKLLDILSIEEYDKYMAKVEQKEREAYDKFTAQQFVKDKRAINDYASAQKWRVQRTEKGVSYKLDKKGSGDFLQVGDKVKVHYEGYLLDGTLFDSSKKRKKPFEFILGRGKVISGWEDALLHFRKGSKGWILIPSKMAYGRMAIREEGLHIPANSPLVFRIEIL